VSRRIAAADIDCNRGWAHSRRAEYDHAVVARWFVQQALIIRRAEDEIVSIRGERSPKDSAAHAINERPCGVNSLMVGIEDDEIDDSSGRCNTCRFASAQAVGDRSSAVYALIRGSAAAAIAARKGLSWNERDD